MRADPSRAWLRALPLAGSVVMLVLVRVVPASTLSQRRDTLLDQTRREVANLSFPLGE